MSRPLGPAAKEEKKRNKEKKKKVNRNGKGNGNGISCDRQVRGQSAGVVSGTTALPGTGTGQSGCSPALRRVLGAFSAPKRLLMQQRDMHPWHLHLVAAGTTLLIAPLRLPRPVSDALPSGIGYGTE